VYWPVMMDRFEGQKESLRRDIAFTVRSPRAGSEAFLKEVRETVWSVNPNVPLSSVHTLGHFYTESMARTSFTLVTARGCGRHGAAAWNRGDLRRDRLFRLAAHSARLAFAWRSARSGQTLIAMFVRHGLLLTGVGIACGSSPPSP